MPEDGRHHLSFGWQRDNAIVDRMRIAPTNKDKSRLVDIMRPQLATGQSSDKQATSQTKQSKRALYEMSTDKKLDKRSR